MVQLMHVGLARWAVLNDKALPALQARNVAKDSDLNAITLITGDEQAAWNWCQGIVDL